MLTLTKSLQNEPEFARLLSGIDAGACPAVLSGLSEVHRAHAAAAIRAATMRPVVVLCPDEGEISAIARDIESLTLERPVTLFSREFIFHNVDVVSRQYEQSRIAALSALASGKAPIAVMSVSGAMLRTIAPEQLAAASFTLKLSSSCDMDELIGKLVLCGYARSEQVEGPGQFAVRGGILDIFSPAHEEPVRCEFFGDEIDSMGFFDISSQRRTQNLDAAEVIPVAEALPSLYRIAAGGARGAESPGRIEPYDTAVGAARPGNGQGGDLLSATGSAGARSRQTPDLTGAAGLAEEIELLAQRLARRKSTEPALIGNLRADADALREGRSFTAADKYLELIGPMATALDYISADSIVLICEPLRAKERAEAFGKALAMDYVNLLEAGILESGLVRFNEDWSQLIARLEDYPVIFADNFAGSSYPLPPRMLLNLNAKRLPSYGGSMETACSDISHYLSFGYRALILCLDNRRAALLREYLEERGITSSLDYALQALPGDRCCTISVGDLSAGMEYPGLRLAVITEGQIMAQPLRRRARKKEKTNRERLQSFSDLSPGDLVVHDTHGIGRFVGFFKIPVDKVEKDYVKIAYAGTDSLYVPATQIDMVAKYIGGGEDSAPVKLSKMGGADWSKVKTRAKSAAREMAQELIKLYAERQRVRGYAFPEDTVWQSEFEDKFGYQETDDQLKCADEIKADMEKPVPMDRLLCGDVGYGKTEVALRAAMKCVLGERQAAILVPTTVLAQQHYYTSLRRFAGYPINIEVLSRFRSRAEIKTALRDIEKGAVDLVIGTHRLLQKDVRFKQLGLLVVDEEQRFGVSHKERLKELAKQVDVLTLSATPIPRTLNMALSGIRDMSTIEEPPLSRHPVQTYVLEHEWDVLCDAIRRETARGGQVYYLHNRIDNIERTAAGLSERLEGISIAVAHGRMDEDGLSDVMESMVDGKIQVLVCTTIIESGIDIPNVNTLIVEDADKLGLAQLHQLRGRVGRSPRRAYAYLTFRRGKALTEIAEKRLSAIREFAEFNSGFKIAMRDLEIRGAGSLLGAEQSGHMMSVGYDMYLRLLEEAVLEEKGEKPKQKAECPADLNVSAMIPDEYVPSGSQRMDIYRRIALIRSEDDCNEMIEELIDRYGDPPREVLTLASIAMMRAEASAAGITEISQKDGWIRLKLDDFSMEKVSSLYAIPKYTGRVRVVAGTAPAIALKLEDAAVVDEAVNFVRAFRDCV